MLNPSISRDDIANSLDRVVETVSRLFWRMEEMSGLELTRQAMHICRFERLANLCYIGSTTTAKSRGADRIHNSGSARIRR